MTPEDDEGLAAQLRRAQEEIARLRRNNKRLRDQLDSTGRKSAAEAPASLPGGATDRTSASARPGPPDGDVVEPDTKTEPSLFPSEPLPRLHANSSPQEKIRLFRTLFRGRDDVYAARWVDSRTGKSGYAPARARAVGPGGGRASDRCLPITDSIIREHLVGRRVIGVYPLLHGDTCWFLACDFDGDGWIVDAAAYRDVCIDHGLPAYLERSRSGAGGHVWILFDTPVLATDARRLGTALLRITMEIRAELDLASYDRFFPNQDFLPKGGFGNLIALPLQGDVRPAGNAVFLDDDLEPVADPWAFLSEVARISPAALAAALERVPPLDVGPGAEPALGPSAARRAWSVREPAAAMTTVPARITAVVGSEISVERSGLPPRLLAALKHMASTHNPEFHQRQQMRLSTFRVPRLIRCYREDLTHLHLPRGLLDRVRNLATEIGFTLELDDRRVEGSETELSFLGRLRPEQRPAVETLLAHDAGVLVAPPGSGKTVMACAVIAARSVPTLVLVHRKAILAQWREQLARFLALPEGQIGQLGGGRKRLSGRVDLAMLQTLARREDPGGVLADYGLLVADECHHVPAVSFDEHRPGASSG